MTKALRHMSKEVRKMVIARRIKHPMKGLGTLSALDAEEREIGKEKALTIRKQIVLNLEAQNDENVASGT